MLFDAHNHLHQLPNPDGIIDAMKAVGIRGCVVNGTSEADWPQVVELAKHQPDFVRPAFGLHPWFAADRSPAWLDTLRSCLDRFPTASLGECGVDRWVRKPLLETQRDAFLPQLRLARQRDLPISIHALKAWGPLLEALDEEPPPERGFLVHSFGGSPELVTQLSQLGAYFSFSGYFLEARKAKVLDAFRQVPPDRLLLETDAPSMRPPESCVTHPLPEDRNHPANLASIARSLAEHLNEDPGHLLQRCRENTARFFGISNLV